MKISKLFNENIIISKFVYAIFKAFHYIKTRIISKEKFNFLGDLTPKFYIPYHPIPENNLYGHIQVFKNYINNKSDLFDVHIQHGVILGRLIQNVMHNSFANKIITYSESRKYLIQNETNKSVISVGPYIRYAFSRIPIDLINKMKVQNGKTLLVFPAHSSVDRTKISFDQKCFVDKIKDIVEKYEIKTVLINLFYSDCNKESIDYYEQEGFKVCSAGYWLSENFLPNLRTLIELSDFTMSNRVGTHIGYCIALNKPHYIFNQDYKEEFIGLKGQEDLKQTLSNEYYSRIDLDKIESIFMEENFSISNEQIKIVNEFWGNDIFYSPKEMIEVLVN
jgi:hypothetical protein